MASAVFLTAVLLVACSGDDDGGGGGLPVPLPINCVVPGECLSVTATWCVPGNDGMVSCATNNVDLSLVLPGGGTIGNGAGEFPDANGCIHDGDDQAGPPTDRNGDGQLGPFSENITCSPAVQPVGPPAIEPGVYTVQVHDNFSVFDTGMIVVDINTDGVNQRQTIFVDDGSVGEIQTNYP
jgi:hypothetical protein